MAKIEFVFPDGTVQYANAEAGTSLMQVAVNNGIDAIVAECGGSCSCATCHCYIDEVWLARLPAMDELEDVMLDGVSERRRGSRLSCQLEITEDFDGLVVQLPESQY